MKKYTIGILLMVSVFVLGIILILIDKKNNDSEEAEHNIAKSRIPKLEVGVDVHALENEVFEVLGPENVAVYTDRSSGSGILWKGTKDELIILTVAHLVSDFETGKVELWSGETVDFVTEHVTKSSEYDIAVIHIELKEKLKQAHGGVNSYIGEDALKLGDKLWILDSIYGAGSGIGNATVSAVDIFLEDYNTEMLLLYGSGKTGMSGCPVYDEGGMLVGMVSGMSEDKTALAAVPILQIMKFLETSDE